MQAKVKIATASKLVCLKGDTETFCIGEYIAGLSVLATTVRIDHLADSKEDQRSSLRVLNLQGRE